MKDIIIVGGGGHARVLISAIKLSNEYRIKGIVDQRIEIGREIAGCAILGGDDYLYSSEGREMLLAMGIGMMDTDGKRAEVYKKFKREGYSFAIVCHPQSLTADGVTLSEGSQVMLGTVIQSDVYIGENSIVNTSAVVEHDCRIGAHSHVGPGVVIGGGVSIGENSLIGLGARILPAVKVGRNSMIGAGSIVIADVNDGDTVVGVHGKQF